MSTRLFASALLAVGAIFATATAAYAEQIVMTANENVYADRDFNSAQIGTIAQGTVGEASQCASGWCYVDQPGGADGWVTARSIDTVANQQQQQGQPQPPAGGGGGGNNLPGFSFDFNLGGGGNPPPRPGRPRFDDDEVCFYTSSNFRGRSFCGEPGDAANRLPSEWNDAISSIEVFGDAEVEVCTDRNMRGTCRVVSRDTSRLPNSLNDRISSFEIY